MGDTDAMGIAYHANYLRWFEVGRTELVRATGLPYKQMAELGLGLPVVEARLRYRVSARYDDVLSIETEVKELGRATVTFAYRIVRGADGAVLCEGETGHACTDPQGKVVRFPEEVARHLRAAAG